MTKLLSLILFFAASSNFVHPESKNLFLESFFSGDSVKTILKIDSSSVNKKDSVTALTRITPISLTNYVSNDFAKNVFTYEKILKSDYRYTGDFINYLPFGFTRNFGSTGQPNEHLFYGYGFNKTTFLIDGLNATNRLNNSLNLFNIQSEAIDNIELIPFVQGFLYGNTNNNATLNFVQKDFINNKPYTRVRYYQAANGEGLIDGIFSTTFGKKFGVFAEFTNQSTDSFYKNSDYGAWLGSARFRYLASEKINFVFNYHYAKSTIQLNGGVDFDSIKARFSPSQYDEEMYNRISAPVNYINRYQKSSNHNVNFKSALLLIPNSPSLISVYYQTDLAQFRQNERPDINNFQDKIDTISNDNAWHTRGFQIEQDINFNFVNTKVLFITEHSVFNSPLLNQEEKRSSLALSFRSSADLLNGKLTPSVFGKYLSYNNNSFKGFGADAILKINENLSIYGGYSNFEKPDNLFEESLAGGIQKYNNSEFRISYLDNFIDAHLGFFNRSSTNEPTPVLTKSISINNVLNETAQYYYRMDKNLSGLNFSFNITLWKFLLTGNSNFYFSDEDLRKAGVPKFTSIGGFYYIDTLFNNNLNLKAGINYSSVGNRYGLNYDFQKSISTPYTWLISPTIKSTPFLLNETFPADYQFDLFIAGQIQESATVYFVFENLLNRNYFISPYYPMRPRSMRIGVAWEFLD